MGDVIIRLKKIRGVTRPLHCRTLHLYSQFDHCVYYWCLDDRSFIYLLLYIDDMLITSKKPVEIDKLKNYHLDKAKKII